LKSSGRDGADGQRGLRIGETRGWALVQVAAFASTSGELENALRSVLHGELPARIGDVAQVADRRLLKTGPEQYWIITGDNDDLLPSLQIAVTAQIGAVTPLSHSRTCIFIEGPAARELLAKGVPLDFHPDVFRIGQFAFTGLHHTPVLIHRRGEHLYELYALRTFGLTVWEWLTDAARVCGYEIAAETVQSP